MLMHEKTCVIPIIYHVSIFTKTDGKSGLLGDSLSFQYLRTLSRTLVCVAKGQNILKCSVLCYFHAFIASCVVESEGK